MAATYSLYDCLRARPLVHRLKRLRYRVTDRVFLSATAPNRSQLIRLRERLAGRNVLVTIAFEDEQATAWQVALVRRFLPDAVHVVCDNSRDPSSAASIREVAERFGVPCVSVPRNPWTGRNASRSHGFAMNWVWQHVLRVAQPSAFGFLDQDLFPTAPDNPFAELDGSPCAGDKRWCDDRWFLWAGYCFFSFSAVRSLSLDFSPDWFSGLDTGGSNRRVFYRDIDPESIRQRPLREVPAIPGVSLRDAYYETRGTWIHEAGQTGRPELRAKKRDAIRRLLSPLLDEADRQVA